MPEYKGDIENPPRWWVEICNGEVRSRVLYHQDHTSYGDDCVYIEPYGSWTHKNFIDLHEFCELHGLWYCMRPDSTWKPSETLLIELRQKEKAE